MSSNPSFIQTRLIRITTFGLIVILFVFIYVESQFFIPNIEQSFLMVTFKEQYKSIGYMNNSYLNHNDSLGLYKIDRDISNTIPITPSRKDTEYSFMFFNESKEYPRLNKASSKTVNPEYIDKLKSTAECRRMWINDEHQNSVIATFSRGRLANQLSSFALQYAISKELNVLSYFDAFQLKRLKNVFDLPDPGSEDGDVYFEWKDGCLWNNVTTFIRPHWHVLMEKYRFGNKTEEEVYFEAFYEKINQWRKHSYIKIPYYTIDVKKFHPYLQELRNNVFKFKKDDILQAKTLVHNMKRKFIHSSKSEEAAKNINAISIHIRLTDYEKHLKHYYNMTTISKEYLVTAMTYMDKKYKNAMFYVLSDDIPGAKKLLIGELESKFYIAYPGNGRNYYPGLDMALLSLSSHSIVSYGSFGMWGALLSGKGETILPKDITNTDVGMAIRRAEMPSWKFL